MKRILILMLLLFSLLAVACTTKYVCVDGSTVYDPAQCPKVTPEPTECPPSDAANLVQDLLAKSKNVESISYDYRRVDLPLEKPFKVWVKEVTVKQELPLETEVLNSVEMDAVIFNTLAKTANAYCESKKYCIKTGDIGAVEFGQYYVKTPLDWIDGITAEKKGEARLANRDVWILQLEGNVTMYVDTFFGVPLRVDNGQERHEFQNMIFNGVTDEQVQFKEKEDIVG
ncbi:MAG: hypothetical protein Q7S55_00370 [Nanoarchaeota archaeon]|nr:hypothetical protein [Nanoarchaeota archaeon]